MNDLYEMLRRTVESVKHAVENDTVIGKPFVGADGTVILPVNKLSYGFVVGGGEYGSVKDKAVSYPYSAATGGGVTLTPVGFLICGREKRFVSVDKSESASRWTDLLGTVIDGLKKD